MDTLYPSLYGAFKSEGVCPICLMEMGMTAKYSCINGHTICHRCKPYYYGCPTCRSPLDVEIPAPETSPTSMPLPTHYMPHPIPEQFRGYSPSAPSSDDFYSHERQAWYPPEPSHNQELMPCSYEHLGCWVKVPDYLRDLHESRCQFRPHLEEEHLPTDLRLDQDNLVECTYSSVGCKVRMPAWRQNIHESHCNYKEKFEAVSQLGATFEDLSVADEEYGDPEELVECKYRRYGCMVRMRRRRREIHMEKCQYKKYHNESDGDADNDNDNDNDDDDDDDDVVVIDLLNEPSDPEEQVDCKWAEYGCRVRPKRCRLETHEEKCNYRIEECIYKDNGCDEVFSPARRYAHERSCQFAS